MVTPQIIWLLDEINREVAKYSEPGSSNSKDKEGTADQGTDL
jgi:hypothetical protein